MKDFSMTQSLASVASFLRDTSWDELNASTSPACADRTLFQEDALRLGDEKEIFEAFIGRQPEEDSGLRRLESQQSLNRTFSKADLERTLDLRRTETSTPSHVGTAFNCTGPLNRTFRVHKLLNLVESASAAPLGNLPIFNHYSLYVLKITYWIGNISDVKKLKKSRN
jgi:hypothetical protein